MSKSSAFLIGGLVGACIGVLYAPRPGSETRAIVAEKANVLWGEAIEKGLVSDSTKEVIENLYTAGQGVCSAAGACAKEAVDTVAPSFADSSDELREKIEAARQRIAAQVATNAESAVAANEEIEVEVTPVEQVIETKVEATEA